MCSAFCAVAMQPSHSQHYFVRLHVTVIILESAGKLKGDAKLTYEDSYAAGSAVDVFDNKEFEGTAPLFTGKLVALQTLRPCCAMTVDSCWCRAYIECELGTKEES